MDKATYSLISGIALLAAAIVFFVLPAVTDIEPFIPVLAGIALLGTAVMTLLTGYGSASREV